MFETDSSAEFLGLSTDPNRKAQGFDAKAAYGFNASLEDLSGSAMGQQLGSVFMDDPWLGDITSSDDLGGRQSTRQELTGRDLITGTDEGSSLVVSGTTHIQGGNTTFGEKLEVNKKLAHSRYDRDDVTGDRYYSNNCKNLYTTNSADEHWRFDRGDARSNAINVGEVVYRSDAIVNGFAGFTTRGVRDKNDWYKFTVGKSGEIDISLTGLTKNIGVALYGSSGNLIDWSDKSGSQSESILEDLGKGDYYTRVYSYKQQPWGHGQSAYKLNISRNADALESYWENMLTDSSVENAALNAIKTNSYLSRNDVIGIIKSAGDYGSVTGTELSDLRSFYNNAINTTHVDDRVKVLSQKVLFSDTSNQWYTGSDSVRDSLGNISIGSTTTKLNLLLGKHFLGTDRPAIGRDDDNNLRGSYTSANGSLFQSGVSANDVDQGSVGTCYFLAGLAGTANDKPAMISDMFKNNGDGTWSVRFETNGKTDYVTVDRMMATNASGRYIYADDGGAGKQMVSGNNELWVALAEKAYAQVNESGRIGQDGNNYYGEGNTGIGWGSRTRAIEHITGLATTSRSVSSLTQAQLINRVNSNQVVSVSGFNSNADGGYIGATNIQSGVRSHVYSITNHDAATNRFTLYNPWGINGLGNSQHLSLTYAQLRQLGAGVSYSNS